MLAADQPSMLQEVCTHTHTRASNTKMVLDELQEFIPPTEPPTHQLSLSLSHTHTHEFLGSETLQEHKKCASIHPFFKKRKTKLFGKAINIGTLICECKAL